MRQGRRRARWTLASKAARAESLGPAIFLGMYPQCNKACPQSLGKPPFVPGCTAHSAPSSPSGAVKEEKSLTLTTHAIVGAAIVHFMPSHPLAAVCLAFASHFLLDAFPHWDYPIWSTSLKPSIASPMKYDRALFTDMLTIGTDLPLVSCSRSSCSQGKRACFSCFAAHSLRSFRIFFSSPTCASPVNR